MPRKRRSFSATFKSKVALDAIKGLKTVAGHLPHNTDISSIHHHLRHPGGPGKIILGDLEIENGKLRMENY